MPKLDLVKLGYPVRFFLYTSCPVMSVMHDQTGPNLTLSLDVDLRISTYQPTDQQRGKNSPNPSSSSLVESGPSIPW